MTTPVAAPAPVAAPPPPPPVAPEVVAAPIAPPGVQPNVPAISAPVVPPVDAAAVAAKTAADALAATPFDLKYPDGFPGDKAALEAFKPIAKDLGLDAPRAQKLVEFWAKAEEGRIAAAKQEQAKWVAEIKADPLLGGANLEKSVATARQGVKWAGGEPLKKALVELGIDNHPVLVRAFAKVGESMKEDTVGGGAHAPGADNTEEKFHRALFNNSPTMWGATK